MKFLPSFGVVLTFAVLCVVMVDSVKSGWSEWINKPDAVCSDTCGGCGRIEQIRSCLSDDPKRCRGLSERSARCNHKWCVFPRVTCCEGTKKARASKYFVCLGTEEM
ncbi:unnamed protein product [Caenorhabditis auriculariae]|uniref:Uncharacterized protein n=1 Tax=Caenorhabditis auriculariae TaxID=2777116 RepID=A0A8S1HIX4_9PELO|nr:unnamed protein product [Caenorhabditis auriculariae]